MSLFSNLVQDYGDPLQEALNCRNDCALFDFSFVNRLEVRGPLSASVLERFQPRRIADMSVGSIRYSVKADDNGGIRSDLTIWRVGNDVFELMSGCTEDVAALLSHDRTGARVTDLSADTAVLAVQGPSTLRALDGLTDIRSLSSVRYFQFVEQVVSDIGCRIGRLGYTGEKGFELIFDRSNKERMWQLLASRFPPAGFIAIDILRVEAGFMLFTNECQLSPSSRELGLANMIPCVQKKPRFELVAFTAERAQPGKYARLNLQPVSAPRNGEIAVTSASYSPHFDRWIGLGFSKPNARDEALVDPFGQLVGIQRVSIPVYDSEKIIPRTPW